MKLNDFINKKLKYVKQKCEYMDECLKKEGLDFTEKDIKKQIGKGNIFIFEIEEIYNKEHYKVFYIKTEEINKEQEKQLYSIITDSYTETEKNMEEAIKCGILYVYDWFPLTKRKEVKVENK